MSEKKEVDRLPVEHATWLLFEIGDNEDAAAAIYRRKFGRHPEYILPHRHHLWLGPIPEKTHGQL